MRFRSRGFVFLLALGLLFITAGRPVAAGDWQSRIKALVKGGALLVTDDRGKVIMSINPDKPLVPASILKVVTSAAALEALGPDYRFVTEFRVSAEQDLYVVGRGDPGLISEELEYIASRLKSQGLIRVRDIYVDNSFFAPKLVLHGTNRSLNPYDAYNGALCVNFNTIYAVVKRNGRVSSAEPQTPLTDMARDLALKSGARGKVRFNLADNPRTCLLYAGDLIKNFLENSGVEISGQVKPCKINPLEIPLFYRHQSRKNLTDYLTDLFKYSNNFMTNQVFLTLGAEKYGPPATVEKARRALAEFQAAHQLPPFHLEEGSGLSRRTKVTATQMTAVLRIFAPYHHLLPNEDRVWFKTGTLSDVKSMVGYLIPGEGRPMTFVIILNGRGYSYKTRELILGLLEENLL